MLQEKRKELTMQVIEAKIKTFNRVEKAFYASIILSGLVLAIGIIFLQTRILQVQSELAKTNQDINAKQVEINDGKQAVHDAIRKETLLEIAEEEGLVYNNNNIGVAE
ncbi:cell division protein FtsL [Streptococcus cameli]